jgi:hypothetical protein
MGRIDDNMHIGGLLTADSMTLPASSVTNASLHADAAVARSKLAQDDLKPYPIPSMYWRVWDNLAALLPATSSADDLGLYPGTWGTTPWMLRSADVKTTTVTLRAATEIVLPAEYVDGQTVTIRLRAGFITTICDGAGTIDVELYEKAGTGASVGSDLITTAATSFKSTTFANYDFAVTASGLAAGDVLQMRLTMAITDTATATAVIGAIEQVSVLADVKG